MSTGYLGRFRIHEFRITVRKDGTEKRVSAFGCCRENAIQRYEANNSGWKWDGLSGYTTTATGDCGGLL